MAETKVYPQRAWPIQWEQDERIDDGHPHSWEMVVVEPSLGRREAVTRCAGCLAPRCGDTFAADPCVRRRHHREGHLYESGGGLPLR